jgi:hypothetical protein
VNTSQDCDKNLQGLKWKDETETAPLAKIDPASIKIIEIDKHANSTNLALSIGYHGYDPSQPFVTPKVDEDNDDDPEDGEDEESWNINAPPGFTILRCRNRGTCGEMAADLKSIVAIAQKYSE